LVAGASRTPCGGGRCALLPYRSPASRAVFSCAYATVESTATGPPTHSSTSPRPC